MFVRLSTCSSSVHRLLSVCTATPLTRYTSMEPSLAPVRMTGAFGAKSTTDSSLSSTYGVERVCFGVCVCGGGMGGVRWTEGSWEGGDGVGGGVGTWCCTVGSSLDFSRSHTSTLPSRDTVPKTHELAGDHSTSGVRWVGCLRGVVCMVVGCVVVVGGLGGGGGFWWWVGQ